MKSVSAALVLALVAVHHQVDGFGGSFSGSKLSTSVSNAATIQMEYIPK
jgi:hypothetical protein